VNVIAPDAVEQAPFFDLNDRLRRIVAGRPLPFTGLNITTGQAFGQPVHFAWRNAHDPIQGHHGAGKFYEAEELAAIARVFPLGGVFVDVGANVGNHSLFVAKFLNPSRIIPVEPNPAVLELFLANIVLNGVVGKVDLTTLGVGLSDRATEGFGMEQRNRNLGGARMLAGQGTIRAVSGDDLLRGVVPSLIKIDVEGMEMKVLAGLAETLAQHGPALLIEVDRRNDAAFDAWLATSGYQITGRFKRYRANTNYVLERAAPAVPQKEG
jgi:FkbM family methyltransferase